MFKIYSEMFIFRAQGSCDWRRGADAGSYLADMELHISKCTVLLLLLGLTTVIAVARNLGKCLSDID
jgi:hypothetical protein